MPEEPSKPVAATPVAPAVSSIEPAVAGVKTWPGAFGVYKFSSEAVKVNIMTLILVWLLSIVASFLGFIPILGAIVSVLVGITVGATFIVIILLGAHGEKIDVGEALKRGWKYVWKYFLLSLLIGLTVMGGLILLIIPGIYFAIKLSLASYYLIDQDMEVMDAYKASWHATTGNTGKIWGIIGVMFLMYLPVFTIIGIPVTLFLFIMYSAAFALLYLHLKSQPTATPETQTAAPTA